VAHGGDGGDGGIGFGPGGSGGTVMLGGVGDSYTFGVAGARGPF
jgi:hypothetical protein